MFFRLASVNGVALPYVSPPSVGAYATVDAGDLLLRDDGTFVLIGAGVGTEFWLAGSYSHANSGVKLNAPAGCPSTPVIEINAGVWGDSVTVDPQPWTAWRWVYRRAVLPGLPIRSGLYTLASINGR